MPTPPELVDRMVEKLFAGRPPHADSRVLDPGCGTGRFIEGVARWCQTQGRPVPAIVGVESDPRHLTEARTKTARIPSVAIEERDFLAGGQGGFDYAIANPPYVSITRLTDAEKTFFRGRFATAVGRFDLYLLFFEETLRRLVPGGRLVFVTPEKHLYVGTATPLRRLLAGWRVEEIELLPEDAFGPLVTYPTITVVTKEPGPAVTRIMTRDGRARTALLPRDGSSWLPTVQGARPDAPGAPTLADLCLRVSCGVATGADEVFVRPAGEVSPALRPFAHPTLAGRELLLHEESWRSAHAMLLPYGRDGRLLRPDELGGLGTFLESDAVKARLLRRTCVRRKPWYSFHENPPLADILRPKLLCKDISPRPRFWLDPTGTLVPRHSLYYIVPRDPALLVPLAEYLNSLPAQDWLRAHCQRAANGFLRLQSKVLQQMPVPDTLAARAPVVAVHAGLSAAAQGAGRVRPGAP